MSTKYVTKICDDVIPQQFRQQFQEQPSIHPNQFLSQVWCRKVWKHQRVLFLDVLESFLLVQLPIAWPSSIFNHFIIENESSWGHLKVKIDHDKVTMIFKRPRVEFTFPILITLFPNHLKWNYPEFVEIDRSGTVNIDFFNHFFQFLWGWVHAQHSKKTGQVLVGDSVFFNVIDEDVESSLIKIFKNTNKYFK